MARVMLALALMVMVVAISAESTVPLFLWSGSQGFFAESQNPHVQSSSDVEGIITHVTTKGNLNGVIPEVVVAFVTPSMGSGASSVAELSNLHSTLHAARSSLSVPYSRSFSSALSSSLAAAPVERTLKANLNDETDSCDKLISRLSQDKFSSIFTDAKCQVVLVSATSLAAADSCVGRVSAAVDRMTNGNFVALLSADLAEHAVATSFPSYRSYAAYPSFSTASFSSMGYGQVLPLPPFTNTTVYYGPQFITANILIGLIISLLILVVALCGISCLMDIKPPLRFATQKLNVGREY